MERIACRGIVVDIEGTTSAARHVYEVLFPYARAHMRDWLAAHGSEPETAGAVAEVASSIGADPGDLAAVTAQLDVPPALRAWKEAGFVLAVYSSGSVAAQQALVANAPQGDLRPLFTGYFDITTAGAKREPSSYRRIAVSLGIDPAQLLFLSDVQAELDAARVAGWQTVGLLREGETQATATAEPTVASFDDIEVVPA